MPSPERPPSRLVYDGRHRSRPITPSNIGQVTTGGGERDFLVKVQRELEDQRESWSSEMNRLSRSTVQLDVEDRQPGLEYFPNGGRSSSMSTDEGTNSYVDTSGRVPLFKAFVDVTEFDPSDVRVTVDKLANKIVVQARQPPLGAGGVSRSFTQRVQLPRFADDARLIARMNHRGILKVNEPHIHLRSGVFNEGEGNLTCPATRQALAIFFIKAIVMQYATHIANCIDRDTALALLHKLRLKCSLSLDLNGTNSAPLPPVVQIVNMPLHPRALFAMSMNFTGRPYYNLVNI